MLRFFMSAPTMFPPTPPLNKLIKYSITPSFATAIEGVDAVA